MSKKILAMFLAIIMVLGTMPVLALFTSADHQEVGGVITNGNTKEVDTTQLTDGDTSWYRDIGWNGNYTWSFDEVTGTLTVGGKEVGKSGASKESWPWDSFRNDIKKVVVLPGTTMVGNNAFCHCDNLEEVYFGEGITTLYNDCIAYCGTIDVVSLPSTLTTVKQGICWSTSINKVIIHNTTVEDFRNNVTFAVYNDNISQNANTVVETFEPLQVSFPFGQFETWSDQTQFLTAFGVADGDGTVGFEAPEGYQWKLTFVGNNEESGLAKQITLNPSSFYGLGTSTLNRFEICKGTGDAQFVPTPGATYTVALECFNASGVKEYGAVVSGVTFPADLAPVYTTPMEHIAMDSNCYEEIAFSMPVALSKVMVANYVSSSRYYLWDVYATNDNTLPLSQWDYLGGKRTTGESPAEGYTYDIPLNADMEYEEYTYVRVYGIYGSANTGYHFTQLKTWAFVSGNSHVVTWVVGDGQESAYVAHGDTPVYTGSTDKAPTLGFRYVFNGWDKEIVPCTENVTYTAQYTVVPNTAVVTAGKYGDGMENSGGTAVFLPMISKTTDDGNPSFIDEIYANKNDYTWILDIDGVSVKTVPPSDYGFSGSKLVRFNTLVGGSCFVPEEGGEYHVGLKVYNVNGQCVLEMLPGDTLFFMGANDPTPQLEGTEIDPDEFATITWKVEGEVVATSYCGWNQVPVFPGILPPASKTVGGVDYALVLPEITAVKGGEYTYEYTYEAAGQVTVTWLAPDGSVDYTVTVSAGSTPYYGGEISDFTVGETTVKAVIPGDGIAVLEDTTYQIYYESFRFSPAFGGFENWVNSGNTTAKDGTKMVESQTQMILDLRTIDGNDFTDAKTDDWTFTFYITDASGVTTVHPGVKMSSDVWGNGATPRFEPCLWSVPFVPAQGETYTMRVEGTNKDGLKVGYAYGTITSPIDGLAHTEHWYKKDVVLTPSTCTVAGSANHVCVCGAVIETVELPLADHNFVEGNCTECGEVDPSYVPEFGIGDINGDGGVDISDVTMLLNGLAGNDVVWAGYDPDLDGDTQVTISDVTFLLNILAGAIVF